jgi:hypothetical protein
MWPTNATGGKGNASRQMAELTPLLGVKQWLDGCTLAFEGDIEGLRAPALELETALGGKAGGQLCVTYRRVRTVAAAAPDGRDHAALRREQLTNDRMKAHQDRLASSAGFSEGDQVWPYRPLRSTTWSTRSSGTLERR